MRTKLLLDELAKKKIEYAIFISSEKSADPNVRYFSNVDVVSYSALVISRSKTVAFVPPLEFEKAKKEATCYVKVIGKEGIYKAIAKIIPAGEKIAVNFTALPYGSALQIKKNLRATLIDSSVLCYSIRSIKDASEQANIREACRITDMAFSSMIANWGKFNTESDLSLFLENFIKGKGAELAFSTIVASGNHGSMPHFSTSDSKLQRGFCVIDFGARWKGYCADMTRTIFIGEPTKKDKAIYATVLDSQQRAVAAAKAGVATKDLDLTARNALGTFESKFIHGLGHGVGLEIHESPNLSSRSADRLKKGHCFTIEPGIYIEGKFGIRIEDTLALGQGLEILTKTSKNLISKKIV